MILVLILAAIMSIAPFPMLTIFYDLIPDQVAKYVDFFGNPTVMTSKDLFSVFRLPTMGIMLQVICIVMYFIKFDDKKSTKKNKALWITVSFISALKISLTSLEVFIYENESFLSAFRTTIFILVILAMVAFLFNLFSLYKVQSWDFVDEYFKVISKRQSVTVVSALLVYMVMVFMPLII